MLGGTLAVLGIELLPWVFPHFADAVSVSQARRLAGFVPIPFALAGGAAVLTGMVGPLVLPAALAAGIALQLAFPGDFGPGLDGGRSRARDLDRGRGRSGSRSSSASDANAGSKRVPGSSPPRSCSSASLLPSTASVSGRLQLQ